MSTEPTITKYKGGTIRSFNRKILILNFRYRLLLKPHLHSISELLEHVVHIIELHGDRRLGQGLHHVGLLGDLLQDLLEVLGHSVVGLEEEGLVPGQIDDDTGLTVRPSSSGQH